MEYRFLATQEIDAFIAVFSILLCLGLVVFFASVTFKRFEKLFLGSLLLLTIFFITALGVSNVNTYADNFDMKALMMMRYEVYGSLILSFIIGVVMIRRAVVTTPRTLPKQK